MKKPAALLLLSFVFICCNKKDTSCSQDTAGISGVYRITAVTYKSDPAAAEQDYYTTYLPNACQRDDVINLISNGTYVYEDAGTKCSPAGDNAGSWTVSGNTIIIAGQPKTIQSFNCSELVFIQADVYTAGDQATLTLTRQ